MRAVEKRDLTAGSLKRVLAVGVLLLAIGVVVGALAFGFSRALRGHQSNTGTSARRTATVQRLNGRPVAIDRTCGAKHHLTAHRRAARTAAEQLPMMKRRVLTIRQEISEFLLRYPAAELPPSARALVRSLKASYRTAIETYNRDLNDFNRLAARYTGDLDACSA